MPNFFIPLTGLDADSTALNTIANNLANMNTTAFKSQTTNFTDLFYQQIGTAGSGDPMQVGSGVRVASNETNFAAGSPHTTGVDSDVALTGNGFFVLNTANGNEYTRSGNFKVANNGELTSADGLNVMGYPAVNGVVNTNSSLTPISLPVGKVEPPKATSNFGMTATLDSSAPVGATLTANPPVFDSLGKAYTSNVTFTKTGTNTWSYNISLPDTLTAASSTVAGATTINYSFGLSGGTLATVDPNTNLTITGADAGGATATITAPPVTAGETLATYGASLQAAITAAGIIGPVTVTTTAAGQLSIVGPGITTTGSVVQDPIGSAVASGSLTFNTSGNLISPAVNVSGLTFAGLSDGAAQLNMNWGLFGANGTSTLSQVSATSAASAYSGDGYTSGNYNGFTISNNGTVSAKFSNGNTIAMGQIALANVTNNQGLQLLGSGNYATTLASGSAAIATAGTGNLGGMEADALEASNVNISSQFSALIIAQRAFEANAKAVTTFDTITNETINMIR